MKNINLFEAVKIKPTGERMTKSDPGLSERVAKRKLQLKKVEDERILTMNGFYTMEFVLNGYK